MLILELYNINEFLLTIINFILTSKPLIYVEKSKSSSHFSFIYFAHVLKNRKGSDK